MGSDRARISFDPTREYRSVVAQQGRVTLEADINEQASIASEALRLETLDIIGPAGTPDNGYAVSLDKLNQVVVGKGTMYVGGWRLEFPAEVPIVKQPDWIDRPQTASVSRPALVALLVTEQSISATEDQALLEVALGGPDTAARTRLMQHILEIAGPTTCEDAPTYLNEKVLAPMGLTFDASTAALSSKNAKLQAGFQTPSGPQDPCCPPAQGGYLGSDNQLVQVTVTSFASGSGQLLWGWNDASFLYRATLVSGTASPPVLQLGQNPLDAEHTPQPGQVIEILQTTAILGNQADQNYVAALQGTVVTLDAGSVYNPVTNQITLPSTATVPPANPQLFVRLWQGQTTFTSGIQQQLDPSSGLAVTVWLDALPTSPPWSRPFWQFAVRPNTPQLVYPQRYLDKGGTPPEGPRQWLCDLAILKAPTGIQDCTKHFVPLPELQSCECCELVLDPTQDWRDTLDTALAGTSTALSICFQPGEFNVATKITAAGKSIKMTGAGASTVLLGSTLEAVLEFDSCASVTLCDLAVTAGTAGYGPGANTVNLQGAVTIRSCNQVDIERVSLTCADGDIRSASCLYVYNTLPQQSTTNLAVIAPLVPPQYNVRVLNSQFFPGRSQVGILMVNADRAQVEGNLVSTQPAAFKGTVATLTQFPGTMSRLRKSLISGLTIVNTAPPTTKKAKARLRKKQAKEAALKAPAHPAATAPAAAPAAPATPATPAAGAVPAAPAPEEARSATEASPAAPTPTPAAALATTAATAQAALHLNLGALGLAHVTATFGTLKLQFISNDKLGNAWNDAIRSAGLTATSGAGAVHKAIQSIAFAIVEKPQTVAPAFRNYLASLLPLLYSTSSQGIVVGGDIANDVRILNNTVVGTAQGIHVALSNEKTKRGQHLPAGVVQICGNTVKVLLTPETTGERHGIYLGSVNSAIINDNEVELTRTSAAGQTIYAIEVIGDFLQRLLMERNNMQGFNGGILAMPYPGVANQVTPVLWKAADNASSSSNTFNANSVNSFIKANNNLP